MLMVEMSEYEWEFSGGGIGDDRSAADAGNPPDQKIALKSIYIQYVHEFEGHHSNVVLLNG